MGEVVHRAPMSVLTPTRVLLTCGALVTVGWLGVFIIGWVSWDPDVGTPARGQFGDSFGAISALFAGLAFVGATTAAFLQWEQLKEHRREIQEMVAADKVKAVEGCFFHLLASLQTAVTEARLETTDGGAGAVGRQALRPVADHLVCGFGSEPQRRTAGRELPPAERRADIDAWYGRFHAGEYEQRHKLPVCFGDLVGQVCRLTYHTLRFIDGSAIGSGDKQFYARTLRAHLSGPELVLLFYHCLSRHGYPDHFTLADEYGLFTNISPGALINPNDVLLYRSLEPLAPHHADEEASSPPAAARATARHTSPATAGVSASHAESLRGALNSIKPHVDQTACRQS